MGALGIRGMLYNVVRQIPLTLARAYTLWARKTYPFASVGEDLYLHYTCKLPCSAPRRIKLGNSVIICKDVWMNISCPSPENEDPIIVLDDRSIIAPNCELSAKNRIHLERGVMLSPHVLVMDHNHAYEDTNVPIRDQGVTGGGTIRIGEGTWVGHGASIVCSRSELVIGRNCVVAANTLIHRSFPDYCVIAGSPARIVRQFDPERGVWVPRALRSRRTQVEEYLTEEELSVPMGTD
jgi:acetyltransferase-like isoleucine patch superfamily enzyme